MTARAVWFGGRRSSPSAWALAGVAADAFGPRPQFAGMRRTPLRVLFFVQLGLGERRTDESGTAVAGLSGASARPLVRGATAGVVVAAVVFGLLETISVTWPVWAVFVVAAWLCWPITRHSVAEYRARRALGRGRPTGRSAGRVVTVHTVASSERGAGARLLTRLVGEADSKEWTLFLIAGNERLASYYRQFGFVPGGAPVLMPSGETAVPMTRLPAPERPGGSDG